MSYGLSLIWVFSAFFHNRKMHDLDDPLSLIKQDGAALCSQMWIENFRDFENSVNNLTIYPRKFELWVLASEGIC